MKLETKDLLTGDEISSKEFLELIDFSIKLKEENKKLKDIIRNSGEIGSFLSMISKSFKIKDTENET